MSATYPVQLDVVSPPRFQRSQLVVRLLLAIMLGWLGVTTGWLACLLFVGLPIVAAIAVSTSGPARYRAELVPRIWKAIAWLLELWAYMALLVDRFPATTGRAVHTVLQPGGTTTVGSALMRLLRSIPSAFVLGLLWCASGLVTVILVLFVLVGADLPGALLGFQRGVLRWNARLVAYHASIVQDYPPFSLGTDDTRTSPDRWSAERPTAGELRT